MFAKRGIILTDLMPGTTYYIRIAAVNINGTGPYSGWTPVTTLQMPSM